MKDGMLIKVCGMREADNIRKVARLGVDFMGFIFYSKSPRCVSVPVDRNPSEGKIQRVGVFVNAGEAMICKKVEEYGLDAIQLHGNETLSDCRSLRRSLPSSMRIIKAISVTGAEDMGRCKEYVEAVDFFLFDTKCKTMGGSGEQFDWSVLDAYDGKVPFLLSGGIGPGDVERVMSFRHPCCVGIDLNSRFEIEPGLKDVGRLRTFIEQIRQRRQ